MLYPEPAHVAKLYHVLVAIDADLEQQTRAAGCRPTIPVVEAGSFEHKNLSCGENSGQPRLAVLGVLVLQPLEVGVNLRRQVVLSHPTTPDRAARQSRHRLRQRQLTAPP